MSDADKAAISNTLENEETSDLGMYLGMPTLSSRVTKDTFGYLCEKIDCRLAGWKTKYLSLAGRITLAKSTFSTIASHAMQTAKLPKSVCDYIDKKTRRFIWGEGGDVDTRKINLISWERLTHLMDHGGLGLRFARQSNAAFLTKLGWRVIIEPNALWSWVLRTKYCKGRCDIDMFTPKSNMSNVWRGITENARVLCEGGRMASSNGLTTLFWDHKWALDKSLREVAIQPIPPHLEGATVADLWDGEARWKWNEFANILPPNIIKQIDAYELKPDSTMADLMYRVGTTRGKSQ